MYITQTGESIFHAKALSTCASTEFKADLCKLTYIISAALNNHRIDKNGETTLVPDGYYNVCQLNEEVFQPLVAELQLHAQTCRLQLSVTKKHMILNKKLAKILGLTQTAFSVNRKYIADKPHRLVVHSEICVHLAEISSSDNLHNGRPSTLFRSVPVEDEMCGGSRTESFLVQQYKGWHHVLFHS